MKNRQPKVRQSAFCALLLFFSALNLFSQGRNPVVEGELKMWHKVTLTFDGPMTNETATPNPFTNYRLDVTFKQGATTYLVPGYYAADGNAANTSASSGNKWRVHFSPPSQGVWSYSVSFRSGTNIHAEISPLAGVSAGFMDGRTGTFTILPTDKVGRDMRAKGWLEYVNSRYLRFKGNGEYFIKQGPDSPENLFAYADFDGDFKTDGKKDNLVKTWSAHTQDWKSGGPSWNNGKGKGLIGAVNYLASEGLNSFCFISQNINGDDQNVFPYINYTTYDRIDVSRMDQWEVVFEHGTKMGFFLHFKTQETENETLLDNGDTGVNRKLYFRELIARFGHNPALNWNLGEENGAWASYSVAAGTAQSTAQRLAMAQYVWNTDPYKHHIVAHNGQQPTDLYGADSKYTGWSYQQQGKGSEDYTSALNNLNNIITRAKNAGKVWAVAADETGGASSGLLPDGTKDEVARKNGLWRALMVGIWGNEWYFGKADQSANDFRAYSSFWKYGKYAIDFFAKSKAPIWDMEVDKTLLDSKDYMLAKPGKYYIIYLPTGGTATVDVGTQNVKLIVKWYNPRFGGELIDGSVTTISGTGKQNIGIAPSTPNDDWLVYISDATDLAVPKLDRFLKKSHSGT
jgi:Domain of unknown function (DUF5060)/Putative collagen-binding domain of a collagenase